MYKTQYSYHYFKITNIFNLPHIGVIITQSNWCIFSIQNNSVIFLHLPVILRWLTLFYSEEDIRI